MTAVLLARVEAFGGVPAVEELMRRAETPRSLGYLTDTSNWISYHEAVALLRAGAEVTHHPQFARAVGEDAARRLNGSSVAALLRSLGSPEAVYRQMAISATKFATVSRLEATDVGAGYAEIEAVAVDGFPRSADHCAWTCGLLSQPTVLFGLAPAKVQHDQCAAYGAPSCSYRITWNAEEARASEEANRREESLRQQLEAMRERLQSMFETAADLIGAGEIDQVLARITDRAALEVRAPKYLLAVRPSPDGPVHIHHKGFAQEEAAVHAERILEEHPAALPDSWLVVRVCSNRRDYGRLLARYEDGRRFFPQERELLEVYATYAATALDSASALMQSQKLYSQSSALLELARALARAGTSDEIAQRLSEAVPAVVDCDCVAVYIWDRLRNCLIKRAAYQAGSGRPATVPKTTEETAEEQVLIPSSESSLEALLNNPDAKPTFIDPNDEDPLLRQLCSQDHAAASMLVPLAAPDTVLGMLTVSVTQRPERVQPTRELLDRLSGVAAQATTALQNGHLLDQITHQALHDQLTGLANRLQFNDKLRSAIEHAREHETPFTLVYLDLDGFKPVNDEFGHDVGDDLLTAVGQRLLGCTRAEDTVARLGGDEFALILDTRAAGEDAEAIRRRLIGSFEDKFAI
ncbi:MAG: sensor domain-containing diguanylate cyclase, partial [Solirubrobacterales bacterium]|nr:sensor domain-containing diguanylate cyclase [Solirubrobacterales bacterium]